MKWHLHVTVQPHWSWSLDDVASALRRDVERHDVKPIVITNYLRDGSHYKELIPSTHHEGDEASACRRIFNLGVLLNNAGWRVKRLKIEGDPRDPNVARRAIYFETHLKNYTLPDGVLPKSTSINNTYHTVRRTTALEVSRVVHGLHPNDWPHKFEIEAAVLDTNPQMDEEWINQ